MTPTEISALLTTLGPTGFIIWWIVNTSMRSKTEPKTDPVNEKLDRLIEGQAAMDKRMIEGNAALDRRLVKVETILEERA